MVFIRAKAGPPVVGDPDNMFSLQYFDEQGNMTIRSGGTRAWRFNNPGNLIACKYSRGKSGRSIGEAGDGKDTYAFYPDYETGHEALVIMLKGSISIQSKPTKRTSLQIGQVKGNRKVWFL